MTDGAAVSFDPSKATLAVLAGGAGSRMGMPKGMLNFRGKPILQHLLDEFRWTGPTLLVTAPGREHPPAWERFHREVVDPIADEGPLRGVLTALESLATPFLVVTTVDMPHIRAEHLIWLIGELISMRSSALAIMMSRPGPRDRLQTEPFPCAMRSGMIDIVRRQLAQGRRSIWQLAEQPGVKVVPASAIWTPDTWTNLNSPDDLLNLTR